VIVHGYQWMDNHDQLIVELTEPNLSRAGQWLNVSYSSWFNRRHRRSGHLFQGRFKSVAVDPVGWGLALSRYAGQRMCGMRLRELATATGMKD
jgi:REP-associated tyrosine transposase